MRNDNVGAGAGIIALEHCIIVDNIVSESGSEGVTVFGDGCTISGNIFERTRAGVAIGVRGKGCLISDNAIVNNVVGGIFASEACTITNNTLSANGFGVLALGDPPLNSNGSLVLGNTVRGHDIGLSLGADVGYADNVLTNNATNVTGGIEIGTNLCGTDLVCP